MIIFAFIFCVLIIFSTFYLVEKVFYPNKIKKIDEAINKQQYDTALKFLNHLSENKKNSADNQLRFYKVYYNQKQYFLALFHLNEIFKRRNFTKQFSEIEIHLKIAEVYELMGKNRKAMDHYSQILMIDKDHYEANFKLGLSFYNMKNYSVAKDYLEHAFINNPNDYQINKCLTIINIHEKIYDKAEINIEKCLASPEKEIDCFFYLGQINYHQKNFENCIANMSEIQNEPLFKNQAYLYKGICSHILNNKKDAMEYLERAFSTGFHEDYSTIVLNGRYLYAELLTEQNRIEEAIRQYQIIKNSGTIYENTNELLTTFIAIKNNPIISKSFEIDIRTFITNEIQKGLVKNGHTIVNLNIINEKIAYFITAKNLSAGQSYKIAFGFSLLYEKTDAERLTHYKTYLTKNSINSGYFYSMFGFNRQAEDFSYSNSIDMLDSEAFTKIITGEKGV